MEYKLNFGMLVRSFLYWIRGFELINVEILKVGRNLTEIRGTNTHKNVIV